MTTKEKVLLIAPELSSVSDELFDLILADVSVMVNLSDCPQKQELAERYLAAHLLTIARDETAGGVPAAAGGPVTGERAGRESRTYGSVNVDDANRYDTTKYGRVFNNIVKGCVTTLGVLVV